MITESYDPSPTAVINPEDHIARIPEFPEVMVSCFSMTSFKKILEHYPHEAISSVTMANLEIPLYRIFYKGEQLGIFNAYVGAPGCVGILEELVAKGMRKLVLYGTCGVLDASIEDVAILIPTSAVRDEGTSYHYAEASEEILVNPRGKELFKHLLEKEQITFHEGKVWTTDAMYRETRDTLKKRQAAGCICVDMECSAVAAFAAFRKVEVFHFFYAADNLDSDQWESRSLSNHHKLDEKHTVSELALTFATLWMDSNKEDKRV